MLKETISSIINLLVQLNETISSMIHVLLKFKGHNLFYDTCIAAVKRTQSLL